MGNYLHKNMTITEGIHIPYAFEYADQSAREGATGLLATDVGKFARQLDNNSIWMLTSHSPVTWIQVNGSTGASVYGTEQNCGASEEESSTTSTTYINKLTVNTGSIPAGTYQMNWYAEITNEIKEKKVDVRCQLDVTTIAEIVNVPPANLAWVSFGGCYRVTFGSQATHTLTIDYKTTLNTAYIRRARLVIWRTA